MRNEILIVSVVFVIGTVVAAVVGYATAYPCVGAVVQGGRLATPPTAMFEGVAKYVAFKPDPQTVIARFDRATVCGDVLVVNISEEKEGWYVYRGQFNKLLIVKR